MENNSPLVSVIMPVFNCEKYVGEAIQSIIDQTYTNWELLICDDCSTDNSYEIIEKYKSNKIKVFRNNTNRSKIETCNQLLPECKGEYITIHDADDYSHPKRFQVVLESFETDPEVAMIGSNATIVDRKKKFIRNTNYNLNYDAISKEIGERNQFMGASVFIKSNILKELGGYNNFFQNYSCEDYELTFRVASKYKSINLSENLYFYRQHGQGVSKSIDLNRLISDKLVRWLILQKTQFNLDLLNQADNSEIILFLNGLKERYNENPSLIFHEYCSLFVYNKMYTKALQISFLAIWKAPFYLRNYRLFFYILRKVFIS